MSQQQINEIEETINELWELYDDAKNAGNTNLADDFASRALKLVAKLPENCAMLTLTKH